MQRGAENRTTQQRTYPTIGTQVKVKNDVVHHHTLLVAGLTGVVTYVTTIIVVRLDHPIEALMLWKNNLTFYYHQGRDALTWFLEECEVLEKKQEPCTQPQEDGQ